MSKKATIKISSDTKEAESGLDKVSSKLNSIAKNVQKSPVTKLATSFMAVGKATELATKAIGKINESIKENIELAQKQQKAEIQLSAAAKNNPYLTEASVVQLKKYAGELQSISTIGDEELLPMMSQLAAAGRTQKEIQDIMSAALDLSASGMMSMDSAVKALNGTLQGNVGNLGEQIGSIKELTAEELKSGKAIEVIKNQFGGMSEEISKQSGGWEKYKNSLGDFKEVLGSGWANLQNSVGNVLSSFFDSITSKMKIATEKAEEFKAELNLIATNDSEQGTTESLQSEIDLLTKQNEKYDQYIKVLNTSKKDYIAAEKDKQKELETTYQALDNEMMAYIEANQNMTLGAGEAVANAQYLTEEFLKQHPEMIQLESDIKKQEAAVKNAGKEYATLNEECYQLGLTTSVLEKYIASNTKRIEELTPKLQESQEATEAQAKADQEAADAENARLEAEKKANELLTKREELRQKYEDSIKKVQDQIDARRRLGEVITEEEENQQLLNAATQAYINMYTDPAFDRSQTKSGMWAGEAEQIAQIQEFASKAGKEAEDAFKDLRNAIAEVNNEVTDSTLKNLQKQMDSLDTYAEGLDEQSELYQQYLEAKEALARQYADREAEIEKESAATAKQAMNERFNEVSTIADKMNEVVSGITANIRKQNEEQTQEELTSLSEQYTDGEISYEEFCERKKEINRKAAQEEYKLKMWEWQSSMLQASASIAQGIA
nr:hypothetical protein [Treponema sp.]